MKPNYLLDSNKKPILVECEFETEDFFKQHSKKIIDCYNKNISKAEEINVYSVHYPPAVEELKDKFTKAMNDIFYSDSKKSYELECYAYIQTCKKYRSVMHCHALNKDNPKICSTFYSNMPEEGGEFCFLYEGEEVCIKPRVNTLYIFSSFLNHKPMPHKGEETRICINTDFFTTNKSIFKEFDHYW